MQIFRANVLSKLFSLAFASAVALQSLCGPFMYKSGTIRGFHPDTCTYVTAYWV